MRGREALDVDLVDDRVGEGVPGPGPIAPGVRRVDDQAAGDVPGGVERAGHLGVVEGIAEHLRSGPYLAVDRPGVRIEQQLGRVAAQTVARVVRPAGPITVGLAGTDVGDEPVPHLAVTLR